MADLPLERLEFSAPFSVCGTDCFGPFVVKEGRKSIKRYGNLFTCMFSRAVHVELLDDMTTDAFINSFRNLIALRGPVRQLRSDCGSNFVGAKHEFKKALQDMDFSNIQFKLADFDCEFIFNTPSSSHMGGVWERQIRSIRSVLTVMLDQHSDRLDTSCLRTFLYEAAAIVNSRPLTVQNLNDPLSPEPLTPNHLLTMKSKIVLPPPGNFCPADIYSRKRWIRAVSYTHLTLPTKA